MRKYIAVLPMIALLFCGCAKKELKVSFTGIKAAYKHTETASFCVKNESNCGVVCHIQLEAELVKDGWQAVSNDIQAVDAKDEKYVDRPIKLGSSICETWMVESTVKANKIKYPGTFRLAVLCYAAGDQKDPKKAKKFESAPFKISK